MYKLHAQILSCHQEAWTQRVPPLHQWSVEDVGESLTSLGYEAYLDKFVEHEIDGRALSLVKDHHLLMTMKLRLGPTLKIIENVSAIKAVEEVMDDA